MLRWIVGSSLKFRYIVVAAAAAMIFFGIGQLREVINRSHLGGMWAWLVYPVA